jgi:predicted glutamine amidotransferase
MMGGSVTGASMGHRAGTYTIGPFVWPGQSEGLTFLPMCRMLGIVSSEATDFRFCLHQAPRSLGALSTEHPHGWGIAVYDAENPGWHVHKEPVCAKEDERFFDVAVSSRGHSLIAHVRKRTVGPIDVLNTHPFRRGPWVFAHNGTIDHLDALRSGTSAARLAEVKGDTDSEVFFAYLLTFLDSFGAADGGAPGLVEEALVRAASGPLSKPSIGATNFLLSSGEELYAFRQGRSLFALERRPGDEVRASRRSPETGAVIDTPWTPRRSAVLIASEAISDEPWKAVPEGTLLAVRRSPEPTLRVVPLR